jgi:phage baseplate assembly protein W
MIARAISFPFSFNSQGEVNYTTDEATMWRDRVAIACLTGIGERLMLPYYGSHIPKTVFENQDAATVIVKDTVPKVFSQSLPLLKLDSINTEVSLETGQIDVFILYTLPNAQQDTITVKTELFSRSGDLIQEL